MQSNLSLLGLYNYDNTIFDNMNYPTDFTNADKATLKNNLLADLAEMEVVYPRPDFLKSAIGFWSAKEVITWNRLYAASALEYNPIENYDRQEDSTDTVEATRKHTGTDTTTNSGTDTTTNSGKDTTQHSGTDTSSGTLDDTTQHSGNDVNASSGSDTTTNTGSDVTTNETAAFNSNSLVTHDKSTLAHGHGQTVQHGLTNTITHGEKIVVDQDTSFSVTHGRKEELTHGHVEALQHGHVEALQHGEQIADDSETTRTSRIHGNIGVTTSQQMLEQELEVAPKLNIMNIIIESFKNRFCLLVY